MGAEKLNINIILDALKNGLEFYLLNCSKIDNGNVNKSLKSEKISPQNYDIIALEFKPEFSNGNILRNYVNCISKKIGDNIPSTKLEGLNINLINAKFNLINSNSDDIIFTCLYPELTKDNKVYFAFSEKIKNNDSETLEMISKNIVEKSPYILDLLHNNYSTSSNKNNRII
jgi:hypothetical protein